MKIKIIFLLVFIFPGFGIPSMTSGQLPAGKKGGIDCDYLSRPSLPFPGQYFHQKTDHNLFRAGLKKAVLRNTSILLVSQIMNLTHKLEACVTGSGQTLLGKWYPLDHYQWIDPRFHNFPTYGFFDNFSFLDQFSSLQKATITQMPAGVTEEWVQTYDTGTLPSWDSATDLVVDSKGNVYVTGYSTNMPQGMDYYTIKYDTNGNQVWARYFNGETDGDDIAWKIALDGVGNVYVGGTSSGMDTGFDFVVVKYNSQGQQQWVARHNSFAASDDDLQDMVVDDPGNVYLTGSSNKRFATVKMNSNGVQQWAVEYQGLADYDYPVALTTDWAGNVYVTGISAKSLTDHFFDGVVVKYDAEGTQQWEARYSTADSCDDTPRDIVVDRSGAVYITGTRYFNRHYDYVTIKLDANGQQLWTDIYDGTGNFNRDDISVAINLDNPGNVYVTGSSVVNSRHYDFNIVTIKYDKDGVRQWIARYQQGENNDFRATAATVDNFGNLYVLGWGDSNYEGNDYLVMKYAPDGNLQWEGRYHSFSQSWTLPSAIAVDEQGEVFITGERDDLNTGFDYVTVKFDQDGTQQWIQSFNGKNREQGEAVALHTEENGDVIVFGASGDNFATVKYSPRGDFKWVANFGGRDYYSGSDKSLAVDGDGNIYVIAANRPDTSRWDYDFMTVKYNANGIQQWVARYDKDELQSGGERQNFPLAVGVDRWGNAYVTGRSLGQSGSYDIVTIKYNTDGAEQWANRFRSGENLYVTASDMIIDSDGNVYVAGTKLGNESSLMVIKYNSAGKEQWLATYTETGYFYEPAMALDGWGNIYLLSNKDKKTMLCAKADFDNCVLLKHNADGIQQWVTHGSEAEYPFVGGDMRIDDLGNIYICGFTWGGTPGHHFITKKYDANGIELWTARHDNYDHWSYPACLAVDQDCNVYVAGDTWNAGSGSDILMVKYDPKGEEKWVVCYNDPRNINDHIRKLSVDHSGSLYVAGSSAGKYWSNFKTIKFSQTGSDSLTISKIDGIELKPNIPNPFRQQTLIYYQIPRISRVKIKIFNQLGQQIAYEDLGEKPAGQFAYHFNANNLPSGIYFYQLRTDEFAKSRKMLLIR